MLPLQILMMTCLIFRLVIFNIGTPSLRSAGMSAHNGGEPDPGGGDMVSFEYDTKDFELGLDQHGYVLS